LKFRIFTEPALALISLDISLAPRYNIASMSGKVNVFDGKNVKPFMKNSSNQKYFSLTVPGLLLLVFSVVITTSSFAFTMESTSYDMPVGTIGGVGTMETSSSLSYELYSSIGQTSVVGPTESANYLMRSGYVCTIFDDVYGYDESIDGVSASSIKSISDRPVISANILDECVIPGSTSVEVSVDGQKYLVNLVKTGPKKYHFSFSPGVLTSGATHEVEIRATNKAGSSYYFIVKQLQGSGVLSITSRPKNVPNPFRPKHGEGTTIMYSLSTDTSTKLIIYDITGKAVCQKSFNPGQEGGKAGANNVYWDGKNDFGEYVSNGAYIYLITTSSKIIAKGQMAVMD
jgi:FlgD Ig-like domain